MKTTKKVFGVLLVIILLITMLPLSVFANDYGNIIMNQELTSSLGEYKYVPKLHEVSDYEVKNRVRFTPVKGATYTATSSDNNVLNIVNIEVLYDSVGINSEGKYVTPEAYINLNGLKEGQVIVTLKQTLNGKTKNVGTSKITVKEATLTARGNYQHNYPLGTYYISELLFENRNLNAKYIFEVDKEGLIVEDHLTNEGYDRGYRDIRFTATKTGTYKVLVKEVINGKEKIMKTITINIHDLIIKKEVTLEVGQVGNKDQDFSNYWNYDYLYYMEVDGISTIY